jgi:hypothetical protein
MTNGEKIQQMFPNAEISYGLRGVVAVTFIHKTIFDLDWWNAEYKEPNKSKVSINSEYVNKHEVDMLAYRYLKEPTDNHVAFYEDFLDLQSVTPAAIPMIPKGRWITEISAHGWDGRSYQCSVCGRSIHLDTAVEDIYDYPYCHCGAKMGEEE